MPSKPAPYLTMTALEIAQDWYRVDQIHASIKRECEALPPTGVIPTDVTSHEFAEWLADQYRLAMARGIMLGKELVLKSLRATD